MDVLERTLYNAVLAGVSLRGDTFFYPNPLESDGRYTFNQGALTRSPWFDASCCPTNIARFIPSVPDYVYAVLGETAVREPLYVSSRAETSVGLGTDRASRRGPAIRGTATCRCASTRTTRRFELRLRIPGWARNEPVPSTLYRYADAERPSYEVRVNGAPVTITVDRGLRIHCTHLDSRRRSDPASLDAGPASRSPTIASPTTAARSPWSADRSSTPSRAWTTAARCSTWWCPTRPPFAVERRPELLGGVTVLTGGVRDTSGKARPLSAIPVLRVVAPRARRDDRVAPPWTRALNARACLSRPVEQVWPE